MPTEDHSAGTSHDDPDALFECPECDWIGPAQDVDWGIWTPAGQTMLHPEPEKCECPECGSEVYAQ